MSRCRAACRVLTRLSRVVNCDLTTRRKRTTTNKINKQNTTNADTPTASAMMILSVAHDRILAPRASCAGQAVDTVRVAGHRGRYPPTATSARDRPGQPAHPRISASPDGRDRRRPDVVHPGHHQGRRRAFRKLMPWPALASSVTSKSHPRPGASFHARHVPSGRIARYVPRRAIPESTVRSSLRSARHWS